MNSYNRKFQIGNVELSLLVESSGPLLKTSEIFPMATPELIKTQTSWLNKDLYDPVSDKIVITMQSFLLRSCGKVILVDTCVGDCKTRVRPEFDKVEWHWKQLLETSGITTEDIDIVLSTHLHVDHVGWNTTLVNGKWIPSFPNAKYLFIDKEYEYWSSPEGKTALERTGDYVEDSVLPIFEAGQAEIINANHQITSDLNLIPTPGHTPGHVCIDINSNGQHAIITGDLMHHVLQCRFPDWSTRFCYDQQQSRATRKEFLAQHSKEKTLLFPAHFPDPTAGYLEEQTRDGEVSYKYIFTENAK